MSPRPRAKVSSEPSASLRLPLDFLKFSAGKNVVHAFVWLHQGRPERKKKMSRSLAKKDLELPAGHEAGVQTPSAAHHAHPPLAANLNHQQLFLEPGVDQDQGDRGFASALEWVQIFYLVLLFLALFSVLFFGSNADARRLYRTNLRHGDSTCCEGDVEDDDSKIRLPPDDLQEDGLLVLPRKSTKARSPPTSSSSTAKKQSTVARKSRGAKVDFFL